MVNAPKKFPLEQVTEAMEEMLAFCIACGNEQGPLEPDARGIKCEACGEHKVYGAEEIIMMGLTE